MFRIVIALLAVSGFAATAGAQPGNLPLSPGVRPASPIGPGMPTGVGPSTPPPGQQGIVYFSTPAPWGGWTLAWAYQSSFSPFGGYGYTFGGFLPYRYTEVLPPPQPAAVERPRPPERAVALANEFPATLSLQFPGAAEVWLNGKAVKGEAAEDRVLTSPVLKPGEQFTFEVKARWRTSGKEYESVRTVTLGPGDRSRLLVVSGTEVK